MRSISKQQAISRTEASLNVIEELRRRYDLLTNSQKRIAEYIVEQSEAVAFSTVDQMAAQLGVNPSTIVRFCYRLGLNGFPDLQERMLRVARPLRRPVNREVDNSTSSEISTFRTREAFYGRRMPEGALYEEKDEEDRRAPDTQYISADRAAAVFVGARLHRADESKFTDLEGTAFGESLFYELRNLQRTIMRLATEDLNRAVTQLIAARRVYVIGGFSAFSVTHYFALVLRRLRPDVHMIQSDEGISKIHLAEMGQSDCLVAFTFPPYARFTQRAAAWAKKQKATIIAVTDTPVSAVGQIADTVLVALSSGTGVQNSMVAPMAVANALLNGVIAAKGTNALSIDNLFDSLNSFLLKLDQGDGSESA